MAFDVSLSQSKTQPFLRKGYHPYIYCPGTKICTCPSIPKAEIVQKHHKCSIKVYPSMESMEQILQLYHSKRKKVQVRVVLQFDGKVLTTRCK